MSNDMESRELITIAPGGAVARGNDAGTFMLAVMSQEEFRTRLETLKKGRERIAIIHRELMEEEVDFGKVPGTPKPTLLKPGAEKLCDFYHYAADFEDSRTVGDGVSAPTITHTVKARLHLGTLDGPIVATGLGSANSWERKHRYRVAELACPKCGCVGTVLKSKEGGWFCWKKKGGCGATFPEGDSTIKDQPRGQMDNPDPWDLDNTILKMAEKRAFVDATLRATATSGLFTQDLEDMPDHTPPAPPSPPPSNSRPAPVPPTPREVPDVPEQPNVPLPKMASKTQLDLIWSIASKELGWTAPMLQEAIKTKYGVTASKDLTSGQALEVIEGLRRDVDELNEAQS